MAVPALPDLTGPGVSTRLGCDAQMDHRQEKSFLLPLNMRVMVLILSSLIIQQEAKQSTLKANKELHLAEIHQNMSSKLLTDSF